MIVVVILRQDSVIICLVNLWMLLLLLASTFWFFCWSLICAFILYKGHFGSGHVVSNCESLRAYFFLSIPHTEGATMTRIFQNYRHPWKYEAGFRIRVDECNKDTSCADFCLPARNHPSWNQAANWMLNCSSKSAAPFYVDVRKVEHNEVEIYRRSPASAWQWAPSEGTQRSRPAKPPSSAALRAARRERAQAGGSAGGWKTRTAENTMCWIIVLKCGGRRRRETRGSEPQLFWVEIWREMKMKHTRVWGESLTGGTKSLSASRRVCNGQNGKWKK